MLLSLQGNFPPAILALADGTVFIGNSIGATGTTVGEVVFNTAITGYQEILTDPSYCQQIVTLTYPHIGNYGVNVEDIEADKVHAAGLIIKDLPLLASNFRSTETLSQYLVREKTVAIANIDTRKLTRLLRSKGAQNGTIIGLAAGQPVTQALIDEAIAKAKAAPNMAGLDLAQVVTTAARYEWTQTEWKLGTGYGELSAPQFHVVAYDFGVKKNILRMLAERGCKVTVVPAKTPAAWLGLSSSGSAGERGTAVGQATTATAAATTTALAAAADARHPQRRVRGGARPAGAAGATPRALSAVAHRPFPGCSV